MPVRSLHLSLLFGTPLSKVSNLPEKISVAKIFIASLDAMCFTKRPKHYITKIKTSFFEWFEVKVCFLKSDAVINDQNHVFFFGTPCIMAAKICQCWKLPMHSPYGLIKVAKKLPKSYLWRGNNQKLQPNPILTFCQLNHISRVYLLPEKATKAYMYYIGLAGKFG